MSYKKRVYQVLEGTEAGDRVGAVVRYLIAALILISVASVILESVASLYHRYETIFNALEVLVVAIFTVEYALRIWSCTEDPRYSHPVVGRFKFALTFFLLFDALAIIPFYLPMIVMMDTRFLRVFRLVRLLRVGKMARYSRLLVLFTRVIQREKGTMLMSMGTIVLLIVFASCIMWNVEYEAQPEKFSSIPETMWWSAVTLTTVGYGDVVPVTPLGKLLGALIAILGIGVIAGPTGILVSGFLEEAHKEKEDEDTAKCEVQELRIRLLERLADLRAKGALSEEEFQMEKGKLLGR